MKGIKWMGILIGLSVLVPQKYLKAQTPTLTLHMDEPGHKVSPMLYGLMTEEINHSYDGGLYAETIRNRTFQDDRKKPVYWSLVKSNGSRAVLSLDRRQPLNQTLRTSLKLYIENPGKRTGFANEGYWGFPIRPHTIYKGSFYARARSGDDHAFTVSLESKNGEVIYAKSEVGGIDTGWAKYAFVLKTAADVKPTSDALFVISTDEAGTYWFNLVSLFPPTYHNRPNGNRPDMMRLLADMKPSFLRFPGGNYLEGDYFKTRFAWKKTLGPLENRPGHESCWGYRSSDGMGLLEYLEWCEDLHMEPVLAVFAGYTLKGDHVEGPLLKPYIDEALEEIEYVIGDTTTAWGAVRAKDGHPEPFTLHYVEVGNEDFFDRSGSYAQRFVQFYNAIKARYPQLKIISTSGKKFDIPGGAAEVVDEHFYRNASEMESDATHYDDYSRSGTKVFVGEWATREGSPTTNFNAALGDAAWMTGMERNSDVVIMASYAPLFVNVNPGGMQWRSDLIGYNVLNSYGSPSYYVQKMFSTYLGDRVVPVSGTDIPTQLQKLNHRDSVAGRTPKRIPALFYVATRDSKTGRTYIKIVNTQGTEQPIHIEIAGASKVAPGGKKIVIKADSPEDTNTITNPGNIVPSVSDLNGISKKFVHVVPPYSVTVLQLEIQS